MHCPQVYTTLTEYLTIIEKNTEMTTLVIDRYIHNASSKVYLLKDWRQNNICFLHFGCIIPTFDSAAAKYAGSKRRTEWSPANNKRL